MIGYNAGAPDVIYGNTNLGIDLGFNGVTTNDVGDVDAIDMDAGAGRDETAPS